MSRNPIYIKLINSKDWRVLRLKKLRSNPICEVCDSEFRSTLATEVHHIMPVESKCNESDMKRLMFSEHNLQSLCHSCHAKIHKDMFSHTKESVKANNKRATQRFMNKFID